MVFAYSASSHYLHQSWFISSGGSEANLSKTGIISVENVSKLAAILFWTQYVKRILEMICGHAHQVNTGSIYNYADDNHVSVQHEELGLVEKVLKQETLQLIKPK